MRLRLERYAHGDDSTAGLLFVNDEFFGYTLEDEDREVKVADETRIPAGDYQILLRDEGGMTKRYAKKYPFHRGMLHLQDVPGFKWIYIHPGNTDDHTSGCLLVGYHAVHYEGENTLRSSRVCYSKLYNLILLAMDRGEDVHIEVT